MCDENRMEHEGCVVKVYCGGGSGPTPPPGDNECCGQGYANLYASQPQIIGPHNSATDMVLLDQQNAVSAADFDLTNAPINGDIVFLKAGTYNIGWIIQARITPPIPIPVPSWSFGFWKNGALVNGSVYSGFTQAPGDDASHSNSEMIIDILAGDVLRLRNASVSQVSLNPNVTGSVFPITITSVNIKRLK